MKYLKPLELYHESLKTTTGRLMGLYVGSTDMGVSISEACKKVVFPNKSWTVVRSLGPGQSVGNDRVSDAVQYLISTYSVSGLVIGYPFQREETLPAAGVDTKRLVDDLNATTNFQDVNYTFWDSSRAMKMWSQALGKIGKASKLTPFDRLALRDEHLAYETLREYFDIIICCSQDPTDRYHDVINRVNPFQDDGAFHAS